jgi:uncharacterized DUF497 family protein
MALHLHFTWDETKRQKNLLQHGVDFADAERVFCGPTFTFEDDRYHYGEQRFITIGMLGFTMVVIAHTERNHTIRLISMRKATKYEQKLYFKEIFH